MPVKRRVSQAVASLSKVVGLTSVLLIGACSDHEAEVRAANARIEAAQAEQRAAEAKAAAAAAEIERLRLGGSPMTVAAAPATTTSENCANGAKNAAIVTGSMAVIGCAIDFFGGVLITGGSLCLGTIGIAKATAAAATAGCLVGAATGNPAAAAGVNPLPVSHR